MPRQVISLPAIYDLRFTIYDD
ncbi:MAG: hypothetical protein QOJ65_2790, partial [Fimbriimonadaceae bacterium]|nr:hypothetical protein [Fimbriimonadaceae bacterium]